ncbi:MAG: stage II sporulation protein P [Lachnospiraceae bacterium]|nr:stage II sporulation protein P [Lachnospiraceae bacterium]
MAERRQISGRKTIITCVIVMASFCFLKGLTNISNTGAVSENCFSSIRGVLNGSMEKNYFILSSYLKKGEDMGLSSGNLCKTLQGFFPIYHYLQEEEDGEITEDELMAEFFRQKEGSDEDIKRITEEQLDYESDALHIENSMLAEMELENNRYKQETEEANRAIELPLESGFIQAAYPAYTYDWEEGWDYDNLVANFFAIDASTDLKEEYVNLDSLLYRDLAIEKNVEGPQILIYHTHSQETFVDSVEGDSSTTIVGAGEKLANLLTEKYGFCVLHHTGEYDVETRDDAYSNSLPAIEKILEENPSIQVVIDLHRDEMPEEKKLIMDLQGRPTARFMFFNGMSHIRDKGDISYLENPYIQDNLAFSFQAQVAANEYYPGIARKIYLKAYRYNMHLRAKSMLIELGAQNNTVEEIMNACEPLAHIIAIVLNGNS